MAKIHELLALSSPKKGDVGIEIECEGANLKIIDSDYWTTIKDGSLRGEFPFAAAEWVLKQPILASKVKEVIKQLAEAQKDAQLSFSFRTSVHVHINVQTLTEIQLLNLVYTYLLIEEPLINYCGKERKGNRFCLRLQDAEYLLATISEWITRGTKYLMKVDENHVRYAAINIAAVRKYGSVEFRSMRGTLDQGVLNNWIGILLKMRDFAVAMESPMQIFNLFCENSPKDFLEKVVGEHVKILDYPQLERDIQKSFSLSIDIPSIFKNSKAFLAKPNAGNIVEKDNMWIVEPMVFPAAEVAGNWDPAPILRRRNPLPIPRARPMPINE